MLSAVDELERFLDRRTTVFVKAMNRLVFTVLKLGMGTHHKAIQELAEDIQRTMILADLHGRKRLLMEASFVSRNAKFDSDDTSPIVPRVPFEEAVDDLLAREPKLAESASQVASMYSREKVFSMAYATDKKVLARVQAYIGTVMAEGRSVVPPSEVIAEIGNWTQAYADTVYRTNVATAYNAGRFAQAKDPDVRKVIPAMRYMSLHDAQTRPNHEAAHGLIASQDDAIWNHFHPPLGFNSFLPGTQVEGVFETASKAFYSGPIVEIKTRKGSRLSVTVNHPILTPNGFRSAGELRKGDDLLVYDPSIISLYHGVGDRSLSSIEISRGTVHNEEMPSRIEDIYEACVPEATRSGRAVRARALTLKFHGHSLFYKGQVNIVPINGLLPHNIESFVANGFDKTFFKVGTKSSPSIFHRSSMAGLAESISIGTGSRLDSPFYESGSDRTSGNPEIARQLQFRNPGLVQLDDVIDIKISSWFGHVYDLQSPFGLIVANGVIASNCRCAAVFVSKYELERRGLLNKDGSVIRFEPPGFSAAGPDDGFRPKAMDF